MCTLYKMRGHCFTSVLVVGRDFDRNASKHSRGAVEDISLDGLNTRVERRVGTLSGFSPDILDIRPGLWAFDPRNLKFAHLGILGTLEGAQRESPDRLLCA